MSRLLIEINEQKKFMNNLISVIGVSKAAEVSGVCSRTVRDWRRGKFKLEYRAAMRLSSRAGVPLPAVREALPEFWNAQRAAQIGGLVRCKKHGNPGTLRGRSKGGRISQMMFRLDPDRAKSLGVNVRKEIMYPRQSEMLAELIGILLGDGGITDYQIRITYNRKLDKPYSVFIKKLIYKLFGINPSVFCKKSSNADDIVVSNKNLVEFLINHGLVSGSKIRKAADVPQWIFKNDEYMKACIRGLIDTDGSFYSYRHKVNGKIYHNASICYTSHSITLLNSVHRMLKSVGFKPVMSKRNVYLHKNIDIATYFDIIGSSNLRQVVKYKNYINSSK